MNQLLCTCGLFLYFLWFTSLFALFPVIYFQNVLLPKNIISVVSFKIYMKEKSSVKKDA